MSIIIIIFFLLTVLVLLFYEIFSIVNCIMLLSVFLTRANIIMVGRASVNWEFHFKLKVRRVSARNDSQRNRYVNIINNTRQNQ